MTASIVGVADLVSPTGVVGMPVRAMETIVVREALADAGLAIGDIDGMCYSDGTMPSLEAAEYFGIQAEWTDSTATGGSSFEVLVEHAATAIDAGHCQTVLVLYGANPRTALSATSSDAAGQHFVSALTREVEQWERPYGLELPVVPYAMAASAHMARYRTSREQLAAIAVSTRAWAADNPVARYRTPITIDDVLTATAVAEPLHRLDCCLLTDGAGAVVVTSAARARDLRSHPVDILGAASASSHGMAISQMPDLTVTPGSRSGPAAFARAGSVTGDVDVLQLYDSFTITVLLVLEDLGFCPKGDGGPFVATVGLGPGGALPTNTSGGGLSYAHPGMFGIVLLIEATRQLRGECGPRQVVDAEVGVAHGSGGVSVMHWHRGAGQGPVNIPLPPVDELTEPFWEGSREGRLFLQWCTRCDRTVHYPRHACPRCLGDQLEWRENEGVGQIAAWAVVHAQAAGPWLEVPYTAALVDVDGARLVTNLVGDPSTFAVGRSVLVRWQPLEDGRALPWFELNDRPSD